MTRQGCSNSGHTCSRLVANQLRAPVSIRAATQANLSSGLAVACRIKSKLKSGFTLVEAIIALGVLVLFIAACLSSIVVNQVSVRKAKEEAIAMDFLTKYVENIKALPFTSVDVGRPINVYYNGSNGGPLIKIPASGNPIPINTTAYQLFYPDLLWLQNRNPSMTVTLTKTTVSGVVQDIQINVKVNWDAPISRGGRQEVQVDFLRTKDVSQL